MMKKPIFCAVLCLIVGVLAPLPGAADSNLHTMSGTLTGCSCTFFATTNDWVCHAALTMTEPSPHHSANDPATITIEYVGEAIGQCEALKPSLPRKVQVLYWLHGGGIDFIRSLVRSPVHAYFLIDQGPTS